VDDYDNVMVTLIADVATAYVLYRIFEQQLVFTRDTIDNQQRNLAKAVAQQKVGTKKRPARGLVEIPLGADPVADPTHRNRPPPEGPRSNLDKRSLGYCDGRHLG
jgi:hypothetical protein